MLKEWETTMIPYSLNNGIRRHVIVLLVLCSMCLATVFENTIIQAIVDFLLQGSWLKSENAEKIFEIIIEVAIPPFLTWSILYALYSKICWKWPPVKSLHGIPDLNGTWEGFTVNDKNEKKKRSVTVSIKQDWNGIMVKTYMNDTLQERCVQSFCECTVAAISVHDGEAMLMYAYRNPLLGRNSYFGYNELKIEENRIVGRYMTTKPSNGLFEITKRET